MQLGSDLARRQGISRRRFFQGAVGKAGWNPALAGRPQTLEDLKFANCFKEILLDSDTQVALISGSGSEEPRDWFLTNETKAEARAKVNRRAGTRRLFSHAVLMPGPPGWPDKVDRDLELLQPDSFKGYTVGENTSKHLVRHPWQLDDEKLLCPFHEKRVRAARTRPSLANVCVHKGLFPQAVAEPHLCAAMLGQRIKGLGADHVVWGTDAVWTGAPQWQIEALRRLEIPPQMQQQHGFAPLGAADGPVKSAIFGENSARLYHFTRPQRAALAQDHVAQAKSDYDQHGDSRTNLRYGCLDPRRA